jgi:hypothetical protein
MAGHSRPKDGVASLAYVPGIHALPCSQGVDARDKRGHDVERPARSQAKNNDMTKEFDWKRFSEVHKPEWAAWLETNHAKSVTEAEFMAAYRVQRIVDTRPNKSRRYSTSKLRGNYRKLRNDYGFFG